MVSVNDWEVALLQVDGIDPLSGILVVRGLWEDRLLNPEIAMSTRVHLLELCNLIKMMIVQIMSRGISPP
jgi:hypothetical protein